MISGYKTVDQIVLEYYSPIIVINKVMGLSTISANGDTINIRTLLQVGYSSLLLVFCVLELGYWVTYLDTQHTIVNVTLIYHLFAEIIISCVCLVNTMVFYDTAYKNIRSWGKTEQILLQLGIKSKSIKTMMIYFGIYYCVLLPGSVVIDYRLLFGDRQERYLPYPHWLFLMGHVCYNKFAVVDNVYLLLVMLDRFSLLNATMRGMHCVSSAQVRLVNEAHDRLYNILARHWTPHCLVYLGQVIMCAGLITSYMYVITSMVIDGQFDVQLLAHCCCWVVYSITIILLLVLTNTAVCSQVISSLYLSQETLKRTSSKLK